jgi:preprotein translocase SecE subunit
MTEKIKNFLLDTRQELRRVNWPTREETIHFTLFVVWLSLGVAAFIGILDFGFLTILEKVIL